MDGVLYAGIIGAIAALIGFGIGWLCRRITANLWVTAAIAIVLGSAVGIGLIFLNGGDGAIGLAVGIALGFMSGSGQLRGGQRTPTPR